MGWEVDGVLGGTRGAALSLFFLPLVMISHFPLSSESGCWVLATVQLGGASPNKEKSS